MKTLTEPASSSAQGTIIDPITNVTAATDVAATTSTAEEKPNDLISDAKVNQYVYNCDWIFDN